MSEKKLYDLIIYTDGGCAVNPGGPGGYGAVIIDTHTGEVSELSGGYISTTNNRMEMRGVIEALKTVPPDAEILLHSDSQYVINTMNKGWVRNKNRDLWKILDRLNKERHVTYAWVRGHSGIPENERCDELATKAMQKHDLLPDEGYAGESRDASREKKKSGVKKAKGGAMGVTINVPDELLNDDRKKPAAANEYAEAYGVHTSCAKALLSFFKERRHTFKSYMHLKTNGVDRRSRQSRDEITSENAKADEIWKCIQDNISYDKDQMSAIRWYARGLSVQDAIRKVLVDAEVRANCF